MRAKARNRRQISASGSRAFTERLEERRLLSATILTVDANNNLYSVIAPSGVASLLGPMGNGIDQIASNPSSNQTGSLYGTDGSLYQVNPVTGQATTVGPVGTTTTALAASSVTGVLYGANTALYTINIATGASTIVGSLNLPDQVNPTNNQLYADTISGDLAFDNNGILYLAAHIHTELAGDEFFSVNTTTGAVKLIGSIGYTDVTGLAYDQQGQVMYAVTDVGQLLSINTTTGAGTFLASIQLNGVTVGMTDATSEVLPPIPPVTIPAASFTSPTYTANLNSSAAVLTVQLTGGAATSDIDVYYNTRDNTAVAGVDYVAESGLIDFPAGVTQEQLLIPILNSQSLGANKDFYVDLTNIYNSTSAPYVLVAPDTADVTIQNVNSAFEISPATVSVNDSQPLATITVQRLGITSDTETVDFSTVYPSSASIGDQALPDVNYTTVLKTLTFAPGQTTQTVQIPILSTSATTGSSNVLLQLTNPQIIAPATGSATAQNVFLLGSVNSALPAGTGLLTINNVDAAAPEIQDVSLDHVGKKITSITVQFSKAVTQASAEALSSYGIFIRNHDGPYATGPRSAVKIGVVDYNATADTATITPKKSLSLNKIYQLVAYTSGGVTDADGRPLQSNSTNSGSNYSTFFGLGNHLTYADADGDKVTLKLAGPGLLDLRRAFNGDASSLVLDDTTPDSVLSGKVVKGKYGDGLTTIDLVGPTGGVNDELTKPPFTIIDLDLDS